MKRPRDYPGEWSAEEWPLACTERDDKGKPCHGRPVPGDHRCARHYGKIDGRAARKTAKLVEKYVGKGPVDMKGISRQDEDAMFLGAPIDKDPGVLLLEEIHRTAGHIAWLESKVRSLGGDELVWSLRAQTEESGSKGEDYVELVTKEYGAEVNTWYQLYKKEREHLVKVAGDALKAGVEERRVRIAERGIDMLEAALSAALTDLGVDPTSARARAVIGTRLREALGGPTDVFGTEDGRRALEASQPVLEAEVVDDSDWGGTGPVEGF